MYCQSGQMERAVERSGGVGKKVSRYDAGSVSMVEDKIRLQSRATEKYYDQIF